MGVLSSSLYDFRVVGVLSFCPRVVGVLSFLCQCFVKIKLFSHGSFLFLLILLKWHRISNTPLNVGMLELTLFSCCILGKNDGCPISLCSTGTGLRLSARQQQSIDSADSTLVSGRDSTCQREAEGHYSLQTVWCADGDHCYTNQHPRERTIYNLNYWDLNEMRYWWCKPKSTVRLKIGSMTLRV